MKLLCENLENNTISEVDWVPDGLIEVITLNHKQDGIFGQYFMGFNYNNVEALNFTKFFKNKVWYIGHIED